MSVSADYLLDRRRLSRQVTIWRAIAFASPRSRSSRSGLRFSGVAGGRRPAYRQDRASPDSSPATSARSRRCATSTSPRRSARSSSTSTVPAAPPRAPSGSMTRSAASPRRSRPSPWSARSAPRAPISRRSAPTASSCVRIRWSARSACSSQYPERFGPAGQARRQVRDDQILAAEGRAERAGADQRRRARGDRRARSTIPSPGSRVSCASAAA